MSKVEAERILLQQMHGTLTYLLQCQRDSSRELEDRRMAKTYLEGLNEVFRQWWEAKDDELGGSRGTAEARGE